MFMRLIILSCIKDDNFTFSYAASSLDCFATNRSVRKDSTNAKRQATQEEENKYQEMYTESLLQRVFYI